MVMVMLREVEDAAVEFLCFLLTLCHAGTQTLALTQVHQLPAHQALLLFFVFSKTCSESVKVKAAKSEWLRDLFLPNIVLFTDKRYFSDSEWNRLEHFAPPYGFMELNYSRESLRAYQDGTIKFPTGTLC